MFMRIDFWFDYILKKKKSSDDSFYGTLLALLVETLLKPVLASDSTRTLRRSKKKVKEKNVNPLNTNVYSIIYYCNTALLFLFSIPRDKRLNVCTAVGVHIYMMVSNETYPCRLKNTKCI